MSGGVTSDLTRAAVHTAVTALRYAARHAMAAVAVMVFAVVFPVVAYFALLLLAAVTNQGVGGPLALPFMMVVSVVGCAAAVVAVLWPVTTITEWLCGRRGWAVLAQIPVSTLLMAAEVMAVCMLIAMFRGEPAGDWQMTGLIIVACLLLPLGVYWWTLQAAHAVFGVLRWLWRRVTGNGNADCADCRRFDQI